MVDRQRLGAKIGKDLVVRANIRPGQDFTALEASHRLGGKDRTCQLDALDKHLRIVRIAEEAMIDLGGETFAVSDQPDFADRLRPQHAGMDRKAVAPFDQPPTMAAIAGHEMELDVRQVAGMARSGEAARHDIIGRQQALAACGETERRGEKLAGIAQRNAERAGGIAAHRDHAVDMVAQVLADAGQVAGDGNTLRLKRPTRADARGHEDDRRSDGAGGQHHLAAA